jgi:hypothetical protein
MISILRTKALCSVGSSRNRSLPMPCELSIRHSVSSSRRRIGLGSTKQGEVVHLSYVFPLCCTLVSTETAALVSACRLACKFLGDGREAIPCMNVSVRCQSVLATQASSCWA